MTKNPVGWFEIYAADLPRAKKFYEAVFQVKLEKIGENDSNIEMWAFPGTNDASGATGTICKMKGFEPANNSVLVYFSCEDCAVQETRVREFGGRIHKPKMSIGRYGNISLVYDTEGNMFGLHSMK